MDKRVFRVAEAAEATFKKIKPLNSIVKNLARKTNAGDTEIRENAKAKIEQYKKEWFSAVALDLASRQQELDSAHRTLTAINYEKNLQNQKKSGE
jgi:hypothetical protein